MPAGVTRCFSWSATLARSCGTAAFFEGVSELIVLADSQQKLRLRQQGLDLHSAWLRLPRLGAVKFTCAVMSCSPGASYGFALTECCR